MTLTLFAVTDWIVDFGASHHTTPDVDIPLPSTHLYHTSFVIVGNMNILLVTSVGDLVLPEPCWGCAFTGSPQTIFELVSGIVK